MISLEAFRLLGVVAVGTVLVLVLVAIGLALWGLILCALSGAGEGAEERPEAPQVSGLRPPPSR